MRYRSRITGLVVTTDRPLGYPYELLDSTTGPKSARIAPEPANPDPDTTGLWASISVYSCAHCAKEYKTLAGFERHVLTHSEEE